MIYESHPWKTRLGKDAEMIERWAAKPAITARRSFIVEQKVFLSAYAIRRLLDAPKLSTTFHERSVRCRLFSALEGRKVTTANWHDYHELYEFNDPVARSINLRDLLDIIIHSLVFAEILNEDGTIQGFIVTSHRKRDKLWEIHLSEYITVMQDIAHDYPSTMIRVFDTKEMIGCTGLVMVILHDT